MHHSNCIFQPAAVYFWNKVADMVENTTQLLLGICRLEMLHLVAAKCALVSTDTIKNNCSVLFKRLPFMAAGALETLVEESPLDGSDAVEGPRFC